MRPLNTIKLWKRTCAIGGVVHRQAIMDEVEGSNPSNKFPFLVVFFSFLVFSRKSGF